MNLPALLCIDYDSSLCC